MENNQFAVEAIYTPQRIPQYQGNPLIEALPPVIEDEAILRQLFCIPEFTHEQRNWSNSERIQMISQLGSFMLPLDRHLQLAHALDTMMRQGYVGRIPRSRDSHAVFQKLYEQQKSGKTFQSAPGKLTAQLSGAFIGMPGMGKSTTIERILARIPPVIYHPSLNYYQVPYLKIETPYDGASIKGFAESIFRKMDLILPDARYGELYSNPKSGAEALMNHAARVIHTHGVGLLIADEIQNLENAPKNRQALMTLLVSASNELGVPILFVGTNKAERVLSLDFRQARRSSGMFSMYWDRLVRGGEDTPSEWEDFLEVLWKFQWVKHETKLTPALAELMYFHSQGIIDIAIKLFALSQTRAIYDESERLTGDLIQRVAEKDMALVQPMIQAIRTKDIAALNRCEDIRPMRLDELMADIRTSYSGQYIRGAVVRPSSPEYLPTVTDTLKNLGFETSDASRLAASVKDKSTNVIDGVKKALHRATSERKRDEKLESGANAAFPEYPVGDYRNALNPAVSGNSTYERLKHLQMLPNLEALLSV
ncbi:AAA family ATPase [Azonexus sp. IMCC34839]|uniref:AAA family ATPase n=1 Tax=Azonexus sp. IMCC34839 TaxID=3133695 RepID=UPI0039997C2D